jgi:hypothetical protein
MICPLCEMEVEEFDDPDGAEIAFCCNCRVMIAIYDMTDDDKGCGVSGKIKSKT